MGQSILIRAIAHWLSFISGNWKATHFNFIVHNQLHYSSEQSLVALWVFCELQYVTHPSALAGKMWVNAFFKKNSYPMQTLGYTIPFLSISDPLQCATNYFATSAHAKHICWYSSLGSSFSWYFIWILSFP